MISISALLKTNEGELKQNKTNKPTNKKELKQTLNL